MTPILLEESCSASALIRCSAGDDNFTLIDSFMSSNFSYSSIHGVAGGKVPTDEHLVYQEAKLTWTQVCTNFDHFWIVDITNSRFIHEFMA